MPSLLQRQLPSECLAWSKDPDGNNAGCTFAVPLEAFRGSGIIRVAFEILECCPLSVLVRAPLRVNFPNAQYRSGDSISLIPGSWILSPGIRLGVGEGGGGRPDSVSHTSRIRDSWVLSPGSGLLVWGKGSGSHNSRIRDSWFLSPGSGLLVLGQC